MNMIEEDRIILERLIDQYKLEEVLYGLAQICFEKAEHVRMTYNDPGLARQWVRAANYLVGSSVNINIAGVS